MSADIVDFPGVTILPLEPDKVLEAACHQGLKAVLIIGRGEEGQLYLAGSHSDVGEMLILVERAKSRFVAMAEEPDPPVRSV